MIIRAEIVGFDVGRVLIDTWSSVNTIFIDCFKELKIAEENANRQMGYLLNFLGDLVQPVGSVSPPITFGMAPKRFIVYDQFLPYS